MNRAILSCAQPCALPPSGLTAISEAIALRRKRTVDERGVKEMHHAD